jgi:hypothetical protein
MTENNTRVIAQILGCGGALAVKWQPKGREGSRKSRVIPLQITRTSSSAARGRTPSSCQTRVISVDNGCLSRARGPMLEQRCRPRLFTTDERL